MTDAPMPRDALVVLRRHAAARLRLVCVPYAGGGAQAYRDWPARLPGDVEVLAFEPPGRGRRFGEASLASVGALADALIDALARVAPPFVLFGHSLGGSVAFEATRRLAARGGALPARLLVSGVGAPDAVRQRRALHALPDAEFIDALRRLNGTPAEVLANRELMELLFPVLRADFAAAETWAFDARAAAPLALPITAFGGTDDDVPRASLEAWRARTTGDFALHVVPGDHFFLQGPSADVLFAQVARELDASGR